MKRMMRNVFGICLVIVVCFSFVNAMADYTQGFVDMEDFASLAADWQNPMGLEDLAFLAENWLAYYLAPPSLAWWEMEETTGTIAYDSTINAYDLVSTDGFVIADATIAGEIDNAFLFDGSGERLTEPTLLDDFPEAITITGWLRPDATGMSKTQCWFSKHNADLLGYAINLTFKMSGSTPNVIAANGRSYDGSYVGEYFNCNSDVTWVDDTWYHVAFTWDASGCEIYVDGDLRGSDDMPIMDDLIPDRNAIDLTIGNGGDTVQPLTEPFKGVVDDVRLYDSVLSASEIKAFYDSLKYDLVVNRGSGSGRYIKNAVVNIVADTPVIDDEFDTWIGDNAYVADVNSPTTTITMPEQNIAVTATYKPRPRYDLMVISGSGTGDYTEYTVIDIAADAPPAGYIFETWIGDTAYVADADDPTTTVTMPAIAITVTAVYEPLYALTVTSGSGTGDYIEDTIVNITADPPAAGLEFDYWAGDTATVADVYEPTTTVTIATQDIDLTAIYKIATYYRLTINGGFGTGNYIKRTVVNIVANPPPIGQMFNTWFGDTEYVANIYNPTTTVTMPAQDVTLTAVYKFIPPPMELTVRTDFPGGNALINGTAGTKVIMGESVNIDPDLRGGGDWFYWNFEATVNRPGQVTFFIHKNVYGQVEIGNQGPAVSYNDGETWDWMGTETMDSDSFTYNFTEDRLSVRFAVTLPYQQSHLDKFLADNASNPHLTRSILTQSNHGRDVDLLQIGQPGAGKKPILFTSRHHACETIATYLLEGFMQEAISDSADGVAFRDNYVLYVVPIVDKDGVEEGDQGKNSPPHDHNRDYGINYYTETAAIEALGIAKNIQFLLDWHCPTLLLEHHQMFYFAGPDYAPTYNNQNVDAFASQIDSELPPTAPSGPANWMNDDNNMTMCARHFSVLPGMIMSTTLEVPYASPGKAMDPASLRSYGADILRAWLGTTFQE